MLRHFDTYQQLLTAMHSTTGSEHDLKEDRDGLSDSTYRDFIKYLHAQGMTCARNVSMLPADQKRKLGQQLRRKFRAQPKQICKFLHIESRKQHEDRIQHEDREQHEDRK